jgi:hypothetical protein
MKARIILASMVLAVLAVVVATHAQEAPNPSAPADVLKVKDDLATRERILASQFAEFESSLLKLRDRLKRSSKTEDKARAEILDKVLEHAKDASISVKFEQMINTLQNTKLSSVSDLRILDEQSHDLADQLRKILTLMREDPRYSKLKEQRLKYEELIKRIDKLIHAEKIVQGQTDRNKTDPKELENNQAQVTRDTKKVASDIAKLTPGSDPKNNKSDAKDGGKGKQGESKDAKPSDGGGKPSDADAKPGESKPGQKGEGQGQAKSGQNTAPPKAGDKGDNQPPQAQQPKDNVANGKKQVEEAGYKMKQAEDKIAAKKNTEASKNQGDAITKLEEAKKKLEDLLRQIREEELERLLAALQARCEKMLAMQLQVLSGTEGIFRVVETLADKKPSRQNQQDSLRLSDNEKDIVTEATKAIEMLEAEGSAVAFPEVFQQVRQDMMHVQRRLEITDVGVVTQAIEKDIVDTLKEMIEALKKARAELDNKKSPPSGPPPPPQDQKLLELIAELKMIRSMQIRVNNRTETYGKMYVPREGEQTSDPMIRRELSNLSERQERIFEVTNRLAKGDNK